MSSETRPVLYVKTGCSWCTEVVEFLSARGIAYHEKNVTESPAARLEMERKSGQSKAPTLDWHGKILADFGVDELVPFLRKENVRLKP